MKNKTTGIEIIAALLLLLVWHNTNAQQKPAALIEDISTDNNKTSWHYFKPESKINPNTIFDIYKNTFGLTEKDEMKIFRINEISSTGTNIIRYQQYHNGLKVIGATANVIARQGVAVKSNGKLVKGFNDAVKSGISEETALQAALNFTPSKDYAWLDQRKVDKVRLKKKDSSITLFPKGELVYAQPKNKKEYKGEDFLLCWKFDLFMSKSNSERVFINATTGELINTLPLDANCNGALIHLPYNGDQIVYTSVQNRCFDPSFYEQWDDCNAAYIHVEDYDTGDPFCDPNNTWQYQNGTESDAAQVNWGMRQTYQYFFSNFSWNSYDNGAGSIDCTVDFNFVDDNGLTSGKNARWTSFDEDFDFGYGVTSANDSDSYTSLDIVAHEFTHGIGSFSSNLDYSGESGALNESFSDIFGEIVEQKIENNWTSPSWKMAEDLTNIDCIRSFSDPNLKNNPDTYLGLHWYTGSDNDKEVHTNSGVQNHFFYRLVEGGDGLNDLLNHYDVVGIGINDAIEIAWTAFMYMNSSDNYLNARDAWIEAAIDVFGNCSNQAIQVANAWNAVGVGDQSPYYRKHVSGTLTAINSNKVYEAINDIYSLGNVDINSISGLKEVRMYANYYVTLYPGFTATTGTAFKAAINPCSATLHDPHRNSNQQVNPPALLNGSANDNFKSQLIPNPATQETVLKITSVALNINLQVTLHNAMGQSIENVFAGAFTNPETTIAINLSALKPGVYFIRIMLDGKIKNEKLIKL